MESRNLRLNTHHPDLKTMKFQNAIHDRVECNNNNCFEKIKMKEYSTLIKHVTFQTDIGALLKGKCFILRHS